MLSQTQNPQPLRARGLPPAAPPVAGAPDGAAPHTHPGADTVWARVKRGFPMISRATVYNTLNLLVRKGLLRELVLAEGKVVFDPNLERHHHFVDERTGAISDVPWEAVKVSRVESLPGFQVRDYQVVMRGRRATPRGSR